MAWEVEFTDEFERWWVTLDGEEQDAIDVVVGLLEEKGPQLSFPHSSKITSSRHGHLRELRVQYRGEPYRILYAFDPRRVALVLVKFPRFGGHPHIERKEVSAWHRRGRRTRRSTSGG
jgi:hypothetical protein